MNGDKDLQNDRVGLPLPQEKNGDKGPLYRQYMTILSSFFFWVRKYDYSFFHYTMWATKIALLGSLFLYLR